MLILHIVITLAAGAGIGAYLHHAKFGIGTPDLSWSLISGGAGALVVGGFGGFVGLYDVGGYLYYFSAFTGAFMGVLLYNIIIAKE